MGTKGNGRSGSPQRTVKATSVYAASRKARPDDELDGVIEFVDTLGADRGESPVVVVRVARGRGLTPFRAVVHCCDTVLGAFAAANDLHRGDRLTITFVDGKSTKDGRRTYRGYRITHTPAARLEGGWLDISKAPPAI